MNALGKAAAALGILLATASSSEALAREYDAVTGRFIQTDPIVENRPLQHYLYAKNNPTMYTDPTGELAIFVHGVGESQHKEKFQLMAEGMRNRWAKDKMADQHMIQFLYGPAELSDAQVATSNRNIQAATALKKLVDAL